jgi:hypothetical protein
MNARRRAISRVTRLSRVAAVHDARRQLGAPVPAVPSPARTRVGARQEITRGRDPDPLPAAIAKSLQGGKLEQACPDCGVWEAAGFYCSGCDRPMGPDDWYRNGDETRRAVAHQKAAAIASTRVKRPRGRRGAALDSSASAATPVAYSLDAGFWPA